MQSVIYPKKIISIILFVFFATLLTGCGIFGSRRPARTPLPTFTPTQSATGNGNSVEGLVRPSNQAAGEGELIVITQVPTPTPLPPSTMTPIPTVTPLPTETQAAPIPQEPTATNTPLPTIPPEPTPEPTLALTAVPEMLFDLEDYTKFPTVSLSQNVVRVYLYVYSVDSPALPGYSLLVRYNDALLPVEGASVGGLPNQTRDVPGPYSRFTNFDTIFVGSQAGNWSIELIDDQGRVVGPAAQFELTEEESTRELYVRYLRKTEE